MSATNRKKHTADGEVSAREEGDNYPTPKWVTRALIKRCGIDLKGKRILECAAGVGSMVEELVAAGAIVDAVELDAGRAMALANLDIARQVVVGDFLLQETRLMLDPIAKAAADYAAGNTMRRFPYDMVITNPPFSKEEPILGEDGIQLKNAKGKPKFLHRDLALEFAKAARELAPFVALNLRLNWAGSKARHEFHVQAPDDLLVLSNRPKYKNNESDSAEYAWWMWRHGATIGTWTVHMSDEAPTRGRPMKQAAPLPFTVVVNTREHEIVEPRVTYEEIAKLAGIDIARSPSVTFRKGGPDGKGQGILATGDSVLARTGTIFSAAVTGNA